MTNEPIHLLTGPTPNGRKAAILLEECGLAYRTTFIDILAGDQLQADFLALNPNNKHPVIVDPAGPDGEPITVWESGAILIYLAEKCGTLIPSDPRRRIEALKWLFFQVANQGPAAGQLAHFGSYAREEHRYPYAITRYRNEVDRQLGVLDRHLAEHEYVADEYSIADIALIPYTAAVFASGSTPRPHVDRWKQQMLARPAVLRGMDVLSDRVQKATIAGGMQGFTDAHRSVLFGDRQYQAR